MHHSNTYSNEEVASLFKDSTAKQIKTLVPTLSVPQIKIGILALQEIQNKESAEKLITIMQELQTQSDIEAFGSILSADQFIHLLGSFSDKQIPFAKLSPLLVGLSFHVFCRVLHLIPSDHLEILKKESGLEPLQHHLNLFANEGTNLILRYYNEGTALHNKIENINSHELSYKELKTIQNQIDFFVDEYKKTLEAFDKALAITWNTNRLDLIEKLTRLKEMARTQFIEQIGVPKSENHAPTGLYHTLEYVLSKVYGANSSKENEVEALQDSDLSLEGLTKLSVWYLRDYWELGLLPLIHKPEDLDLSPQHSEETRIQYHQHLFNVVQDNLNRLNIGTVGELKKAQVFSKKMLKEYIASHHHSL